MEDVNVLGRVVDHDNNDINPSTRVLCKPCLAWCAERVRTEKEASFLSDGYLKKVENVKPDIV